MTVKGVMEPAVINYAAQDTYTYRVLRAVEVGVWGVALALNFVSSVMEAEGPV
jgi:hypothetical protein